MLSVEEVARHYGLRPDTVRRKIRNGDIDAIRIGRTYRLAWPDIWACEDGPMPKRARIPRYQNDLIGRRSLPEGSASVCALSSDGSMTDCPPGMSSVRSAVTLMT